ncbi:MAG: histidinol phosphatase-like enzyme [Candidatus Pelagisphaera sp.]|jgi:histidinol phosphatase-like enzyme
MKTSSPEALFLDRDGTLMKWVDYLNEPGEVVLEPGIAQAL